MGLSLARRYGSTTTRPGGVGVRIEVRQDDLRDLMRAVNRHGDRKAVRKALMGGLRDSVKPLVPKARRRVLSQATTGTHHSGLRKDMARAVQVKVDLGVRSDRIGVRIRLDGKKLAASRRPAGLVAMYEGVRPWRHPTFGGPPWVEQEPRGFLTETVEADRAAVGRRIEYVMTTIGRKIDQGSAT